MHVTLHKAALRTGAARAATVLLLGSVLLLTGARRGTIRFARTTQLGEAELSVKMMSDAVASPLPPPTRHTYERRQGTETSLVDLYDPIELWRHAEHIGKWTDPSGNVLSIARMTTTIPNDLRGKHAPREAIVKLLERPTSRPNVWTTAMVRRWVRDYTQSHAVTVTDMARPPRRFIGAMALEMADRGAIGYAVRFNTRHVGLARAPDTWHVIVLKHAATVPTTAARKALLNSFLPSFSPSRRTSSSRRSSPSRSMQHRDYRSSATGVSGLATSRQQAEESIRNLKGWWVAHTDHYVFLSNLDSRHRTMVRELQEDLEVLRQSFETLLAPTQPIDAACVVRIFATPEEYDAYVPREQRWTSGLWIASTGELVIRPPPDERDRQGHRESILRIAYHEAFHQYLHYALGRLRTAAWFNEGHAALFEAAQVRRRRTPSIKQDKQKVDILEKLARAEQLHVAPLLRMSYQQFYASDERTRVINYATAWGLVYYLRKAAPVDLARRYDGIADAYIRSLVQQGNGQVATRQAFHGVDMERFEKDFSEFWESHRRRDSARRHRVFR